MKTAVLPGLLAASLLLGSALVHAQYKAPSQYFRKDSPGVKKPGGQDPSAPNAPSRPAASEKPKFKDLSLNAQFYFLNDTNRAFPWTKVTATSAKNAKGVTRPISGETLVAK